jgi:hypothetical protein
MPSAVRALPTIRLEALMQVIGGRVTPRTTLDPVLLEGIQTLSQAIVSVGQSLSSAKSRTMQMVMQMMQEMMGRRQ